MNLVYFVDNKLGGVTSLNYNLASNAPSGLQQTVIHIKQKEWNMTSANVDFPGSKNVYFNFSGDENSYSSIKNLHKLLPQTPGALVLNYENEMAMLDHYPSMHTTYQLVHDHYNLKLSKKYGHVVDVFICHNSTIYRELLEMYPDRKEAIFFLPHGVKIPSVCRTHSDHESGAIKLLFLGRMAASKGIFDLPKISRALAARKVEFEWTCIGNGPELVNLQSEWKSDNVSYFSPSGNDEVLQIASSKDVFVLPTKFEGSPVSLIETMSVGLVPVISRIPGGITDIVKEEIGYAITMDHNEDFANAIAELYFDRQLLKLKSEHCRKKIEADYDLTITALRYYDLFLRYKEFYRTKEIRKIKIGARLDHPLMPSRIVKMIRKVKNRRRNNKRL